MNSKEDDIELGDDARHTVQFYDADAVLIREIGRALCVAVDQGHAAICIAGDEHREGLERHLADRGIDVAAVRASGQYVPIGAAQMLEKIFVAGRPDPNRFTNEIGSVVDESAARFPRVWMFGEMVALLCANGNYAGAVELEKLWTIFANARSVCLCCAYPMDVFSSEEAAHSFAEVCDEHCRILHSDSSLALSVRRGPRAAGP